MLLFTATELRTLTRQPLTDAQCELAHELTDDAIRGEVGDRLTNPLQPGVKTVALMIAARILTNPGGLRSEQAGGMLQTYADSETGVVLSSDERRRLRRSVGLSAGASMLDIAPVEQCSRVTVWRPV
ncbi:hypothetical protein [Streptomyces tsukubensis]|uniref:hypothetical protein n=1 Tax=Streptomyces tsukubensis TaxID=83656 RepID=UPI00344D1B39